MMCENYENFEKEVRDLEEGGVDSFRIDIMMDVMCLTMQCHRMI